MPRRADPLLLVALVAFLGLLFVALFGERIAPHEPIYFVPEHGSDPRPYDPGIVFPLGSDVLGRDLVSLVLAGARTTLTIVVLGGLARVAAGVLIAALSSWWRPTRIATESIAELVSAVPATLVALVLVKVFVRGDATPMVFVAALLVIGWAGPYRVIRAEVDRLARAPFTQGALAMGVGRWRLFHRHHLPHLVPVIALNLSQQVVAALVLVAELGVLSVFVGGTRFINLEESLSVVRTGPPSSAVIADVPEWGGLLASARTAEALWTTRWLILIPGVAMAIAAVCVAAIGFAFAHRYARRNIAGDLRGRFAAALAICCVGLFVVSGLLPERYAMAREWALAARSEVAGSADTASAFADAGLRPLSGSFAISRDTSAVSQTGPATVRIGSLSLTEEWPRPAGRAHVDRANLPIARSLVTAATGGGSIEAPVVYVGRGISPATIPPQPRAGPFFPVPDLGSAIREYADDYAGVDVKGKVVLLARFLGIAGPRRERFPNGFVTGLPSEVAIEDAIKRGAAAVLFIDPAMFLYTDTEPELAVSIIYGELQGGRNPYLRAEQDSPAKVVGGAPVVVLSTAAANALVAPLGLDFTPFRVHDDPAPGKYRVSPARDLGITARVEVPLTRQDASVTSYAAAVGGVPSDAGHVLVWAIRRPGESSERDVVAAVGRALSARRVPFIVVDFDPAVDRRVNTQFVRSVLEDRRIALVVVLDRLHGSALRFTTPHGDLIPALDLYAARAGARHAVTRTTAAVTALFDIAPYLDLKTILITGTGGNGDLRADAAAMLGYLAGRQALGAPELPK